MCEIRIQRASMFHISQQKFEQMMFGLNGSVMAAKSLSTTLRGRLDVVGVLRKAAAAASTILHLPRAFCTHMSNSHQF